MRERADFILNVRVTVNLGLEVLLTLTLHNNSPNDYYLSESSILYSGFLKKNFRLEGPSHIPCGLSKLKNGTEVNLIFIKSGDIKSHTVTLSDFCFFGAVKPGIYRINFFNSYRLYNENNKHFFKEGDIPDEHTILVDQDTFVIGDNPEDIALKSLTYESGL